MDTEAPNGWLLINNGAISTTSRTVNLQIGFDSDTVEMRLGNHPDLSEATWEPATFSRVWELDTALQPGEYTWVYVEFRDAAGNSSGDYVYGWDSILFVGEAGRPYNLFLPVIVR